MNMANAKKLFGDIGKMLALTALLMLASIGVIYILVDLAVTGGPR